MKNLSKANGLEHQTDVTVPMFTCGLIKTSNQDPALIIRQEMDVETFILSLQSKSTEFMEFFSVQREVRN